MKPEFFVYKISKKSLFPKNVSGIHYYCCSAPLIGMAVGDDDDDDDDDDDNDVELFLRNVDRRKALSPITSREHCQKFSPFANLRHATNRI